MASSSASLSDSRSEGHCRIGIYISTSSSSLTQEKNVPQLCEWVFVFVCVCVNKCCDRAACQSARVMSGNKNKRDECDARIASSVSLRSTVIVSLFSPQLIPGSPALHPLGPDAHFISIHPTTPSIRCTCLLGSIYHRNSLLIWVPLPSLPASLLWSSLSSFRPYFMELDNPFFPPSFVSLCVPLFSPLTCFFFFSLILP